jgi:scyllo-inositol 2-dehydrogenase (NADP+)
MGYYDDLLKALHGKAANPVPAADAVKTMKIIDAAFESAKQKKMVDF